MPEPQSYTLDELSQQGWKPADSVATPSAGQASMRAVGPQDPVTLGELMDDPAAAMKRIGQIVGRDLSDPKLWMQAAAMYLAPRAFEAVSPILARAATAAKAGAGELARSPGMARDLGISVLGERANALGRIGGRIKDAVQAGRAAYEPPAEPAASAPAAATPSVPAPAAPASPPPMLSGPSAESPAPGSAPVPARPLSQLWQAMEQSRTRLTAQEMGPAMKLMAQGKSADQAVAEVVAQRAPAPTVAASTVPRLTSAESTLYLGLLKRGVPSAKAMETVLAQRALAAQLGMPSDADVAARVLARNTTGRWPQ